MRQWTAPQAHLLMRFESRWIGLVAPSPGRAYYCSLTQLAAPIHASGRVYRYGTTYFTASMRLRGVCPATRVVSSNR